MDLTGRHLGKYELLERVGRGGMAYVYKAYQPTIDRHVAIKVLHSHLAEDDQFLERFKREAKGLGSLRHPHIVSVIDFDMDDGWYYMVMDFIEGETLEAMLKRRGQLPVDEALQLTAQLAGALDYAHRHGRIHRDIKPSNVMFLDEQQQHAVITDFGLTRLLDNATITISGTVAGTPAYMSPEAAQGERVDARADIYSLGVILYEMVTGQRPYGGETPLSIIMKLVLEPLPPALSLNPDLPPAVDDIIKTATAKDPDERYQTAAEFQQALQEQTSEELPLVESTQPVRPDAGPVPSTSTTSAGDGEQKTEILSPPTEAQDEETPPAEPAPTQVAPNQPQSDADAPAAQSRSLPKPLLAAGILLAMVLAMFVLFNQFASDAPGGDAETPEATAAVVAGEETAPPVEAGAPTEAGDATEAPAPVETTAPTEAVVTPQPAGFMRFAEPDENNLREYTLSLEDVPAATDGFTYQLWFDFAGRQAPQNVAEITVEDNRVNYSDILVQNLAADLTSVRVSLEPEFDDDPTISSDVVYTGTVQSGAGLAEIEMFAAEGN